MSDYPNKDYDGVKVPTEYAALLFVPTEEDTQRLVELFESKAKEAEEFKAKDPTLWRELKAQILKQRE